MKIVINNNGERIPATLEVVDGVMIVSPVKDKVDITKFKDGDVVVYHYGEDASTIAVLQGEVDTISKYLFIEDYVCLDSVEGLLLNSNYTDSATWVRYATEEEKQKLVDALAKEGKAWDAEKKAVVDLKWRPYMGEIYYSPLLYYYDYLFKSHDCIWADLLTDNDIYNKGWCFKTKEECEAFCKRLNEAIEGVKP
jgi:signal peptidase I